MRRIAVILIFLAVLGGILFYFRDAVDLSRAPLPSWIPGRSGSPPPPELLEYVRIRPARGHLAPSDVTPGNAFYYIRKMRPPLLRGGRLDNAYSEYEKFKELGYQRGVYAALEELHYESAELLRLAYKSAEIEACQVVTVTSREAPQHYLSGVVAASEVLHFVAERNAARGRFDAAFRDWQTMLALGDHITRGGILSNAYTDVGVTATACRSMRRVANTANLPERLSSALITSLLDIEAGLEPVAEVLRYEYVVAVAELEKTYNASHELQKKIDFRELKRHADALFSQIILLAQTPFAAPEGRQSEDVPSALLRIGTYDFGDPAINEAIRSVVPRFGDVRQEFLLQVVNLRATAVFLAITAYRQDHNGELPVSLRELVPSYLPELPLDPFQKGRVPLKYLPPSGERGWRVYSVGPDQEDDEGQVGNFEYGYRPRYGKLEDVCYSPDEFKF